LFLRPKIEGVLFLLFKGAGTMQWKILELIAFERT
jgi:hypothetical protein